jgi:hypothetical protein
VTFEVVQGCAQLVHRPLHVPVVKPESPGVVEDHQPGVPHSRLLYVCRETGDVLANLFRAPLGGQAKLEAVEQEDRHVFGDLVPARLLVLLDVLSFVSRHGDAKRKHG